MDKRLIYLAAKEIKFAYDSPHNNVKSTEWNERIIYYKGQPIQCIAIAGTNDWIDWGWNLLLASWDSVKLGSYYAARRIQKRYIKHFNIPLLICGHSKSGPTAMYLGKLLNADYCIGFMPAPGFRRKEKLINTLKVIDPNDIVQHLGRLNFNQPDCEEYLLPDDKEGYDLSDHSIDNAIKHFEKY